MDSIYDPFPLKYSELIKSQSGLNKEKTHPDLQGGRTSPEENHFIQKL